MKKIISLMMVVIMIGAVSFADVVTPMLISEKLVPTLYEGSKNNFEVNVNEDEFTITINENPTTGYMWEYKIIDENSIEYVSDNYIEPNTNLIGAGGKREFIFRTLKNSTTLIEFNYKRSWENESIETLNLIIKNVNGEIEISENTSDNLVLYNNEIINYDVDLKIIENITMLPLRFTLEKMGYEIKWNDETKSVEIIKGAQWTSIKIGENSYFKNRMAPIELSSAPIIVEGRTMVPVEFFTKILSKGINIENGKISFSDYEMAFHSGYITEVNVRGNGDISFTLSNTLQSTDMLNQIIIHTDKENTVFNRFIKKGDYINTVCSQVTTMSIPAQTYAYIIY